MSKNRNRTKRVDQTPQKCRSQFEGRKLLKKYGSFEDAHAKLHKSLFEGVRRRKGVRPITIPHFQGWYFEELEGGYRIIPPVGAIPTKKVCNTDPLFRGEAVSVLPTDTSIETLAKGWIRTIIHLTRENQSPSRGVGLFSNEDGTTSVVVKTHCPQLEGLQAKIHKLGVLFCNRFKYHLGVVDPHKEEKLVGAIRDNAVYNKFLGE